MIKLKIILLFCDFSCLSRSSCGVFHRHRIALVLSFEYLKCSGVSTSILHFSSIYVSWELKINCLSSHYLFVQNSSSTEPYQYELVSHLKRYYTVYQELLQIVCIIFLQQHNSIHQLLWPLTFHKNTVKEIINYFHEIPNKIAFKELISSFSANLNILHISQ